MSKTVLMIVGIGLAAMGVLALIPSLEMASEPVWHAWVKVIVGVVGVLVAATDKK
jgi:uncharacterized membrane protein HdeD (DUF308 family)